MIHNETCPDVLRYKETIRWKGAPLTVDAVRVGGQIFIVSGKFIKTAKLRDEWQEDVHNPEMVIPQLKNSPLNIDILEFWQRIPDSEAKYSYYREWREIAAIPITTHKHWFEKQINQKARNKIRKAAKLGVEIQEEELSDRLIRGVVEIYNESPVKRGKRFWHYGKDFATVKEGLSRDLDRSVLVSAYHNGELIGFIKFMITDRYAMTSLILDKMSHRDKAPMNGLISKVVEICSERGIPYFTYTVWRRGAHGQFQESNGFIKMSVPEYSVPLTMRGRLALSLNLHRGAKGLISEKMMIRLLDLRAKWYALKFRKKPFNSNDQGSQS